MIGRRALVVGLILATAAAARPTCADEEAVEERAFVEVVTSREAAYVGQDLLLTLRFGYDTAWFSEHAVPLFRREMDVPVDVAAPWVAALDGGTPLAGAATPPASGLVSPARFALNGDAGRATPTADATRGGRTFATFEVEARYRLTTPGAMSVSAPTLRFAYADRFETDLVGGRVAVDRKDAVVRGGVASVRVLPLPEADRPAEFSGAVGRFTVSGTTDRATVVEGHSLRLVLTIAGDGLLDGVPPPRLDQLEAWHEMGATTIDVLGVSRVVTSELVPTATGVVEIPSVAFAFFDPTPPGAYRVVRTEAISIRVEPRPPPGPDAAREREDEWGFVRGFADLIGAAVVLGFLAFLGVLAVFVVLAVAARRARRR